jgi:hypothetical protein
MAANDPSDPSLAIVNFPAFNATRSRPDESEAADCRQPRIEYSSEQITRRPTLTSDLRLSSVAHRILRDDYGSEGWGFDSLPAR